VNDILRLSKVGSQELRLTDVNLSDITQISVEEFKRIYSAIKYKISIQPQMVIKADPGLVRILMDNLIGNAMKFSMKSNSPEIEIGKVKHNGEDVYYVKDNGVGLDKDKSGKIFEPFVRLHSSRDFPGTGVGLAIVNKIIQKHNGKIWISSEPGKGTTFYFVLSAP
jgi:light-regulated signal transduction histidine kinase (bacteriophytochrome)